MAQLPKDSRLYRVSSEDPLTFRDHMLISILDQLRLTSYYSMLAASAQADKKSWAQAARHAPKPLPRPGQTLPERRVVEVPAVQGANAVRRIMERKSKGG